VLYVQFDAAASSATEREPPAGVVALLRARHLGDVLAGLALRAAEPAIMVLRCAVVLALGPEAIEPGTWTARGLDARRGFSLAMGGRDADARFPLGLAAFAGDPSRLGAWLEGSGVASRAVGGGVLSAGEPGLADAACTALGAPWPATLASDHPYLELLVRLGHPRPTGGLWAAATRKGARFQTEMVARLPGLPPLHVIARDPPDNVAEVILPGNEPPVTLRSSGTAPIPIVKLGPPTWDEPGPCDCGVPPDLCAMKRFRLTPAEGAAPSALPGADIFRQLSAAIVDLHEVQASAAAGIVPGDRVLLARSPESLAALSPGDTVLDAGFTARPVGVGRDGVLGGVMAVLPWPSIGREDAFRRAFSGLW
jgi:hypothetical protein